MFPWKQVKLGQGRIDRGPDKGEEQKGIERSDEGGVLSFRNWGEGWRDEDKLSPWRKGVLYCSLSLTFYLSLWFSNSLPLPLCPWQASSQRYLSASIPLITIQLATPTVELLHSVKSIHLASPDTFMFSAFFKLAAIEPRNFCTKHPSVY